MPPRRSTASSQSRRTLLRPDRTRNVASSWLQLRRAGALALLLACQDPTGPRDRGNPFTPSAAATTLTASPTTLAANATATITVVAKSVEGVAATTGGAEVTLAADGGTLSAVSDHDDGSYTASLTSASPRLIHVTGTINGAAIAQNATVTFTGAVPAVMTKAAGDAQSGPVATAVVTAPSIRITDIYGGPVEGVDVSFTVESGGGSVAGGSQTTNADGIATVGSWILGPASGPNSLVAQAGPLSTTFTAMGTTVDVGSIEKIAGDGQSVVAGMAVATSPTVRVLDTNGTPMAGTAVVFTAANGASVQDGAQLTDALGIAAVGGWTLSTMSGPNILTVTAGDVSTTFSAMGVAGAATVMTKVAGDGQSAPVGEPVPTSPSVRITDANGNPVAGAQVTFVVASGGGTLTGSTPVTDGDGVAAVGGWTLGASAGENTLSATSGALSASFSATATPVLAGAMTKNAGDAQTAIAGEAVAIAPAVRITDGNGVPISGALVTFAVASGGGTASGTTQSTNAGGVATVGGWTLGTTAGANTLSATSGTLSVTFTATGTAGAPAVMVKVAGDAQTATAGQVVAIAPSVSISDANGNPVSGVSVVFSATTGGGSVTGSAQTTDANGLATVGSWTLGPSAGAQELTATAGSLVSTFTATADASSPARMVRVAGDGQSAVVGTPVPIAPSARVEDAAGNPVAGVTVTFAVASGGGSVTGATAVTDASGVATIGSWTLGPAAGTDGNTLTATAGALTATFTASGTAGALDHFAVEAAGGGAIATQTAGAPFDVRITAQDANGNTVTGFTGTVDITSTGTLVTTSPTAAFTAGVLAAHAVTITNTGSFTLTATNSAGPEAGTSAAFTVNSSGPASFEIEASGGGDIGAQTAGTPFGLRITAQDASGNTVTSFTGTVELTSAAAGAGGAGFGTSPAFVAGVLNQSVTLTVSTPTATIVATRSGGSETGTSNSFAVASGALHHYAVEAAGGGAIADQTSGTSFNIRITARDASDNTVTGFTGTVDITSTGTLSAGSGTTAAFASGVLASHGVTFSDDGTFTITATRTSGGTETGVSNSFTVRAPLSVTGTSPTDGATGIAPNGDIAITFNRAVTATTSSFTIQCPAGAASRTYTVAGSPGAAITLDPSLGLPGSTSCTIKVLADQIEDADGLHPVADESFSFTTGSAAAPDVYPQTAIGNVSVNSASIATPFSVTANDAVDSSSTITAYGPDASTNTHLSAKGGTIVMTTSGANLGQFTYDPPVGFSGTDSFSYTVTTNGSPSSATVSIPVSAPVWFIDNNSSCSASCNGRLSHPFTSLAAFAAVNGDGVGHPAASQVVFLFQSATGYSGPVTLLDGQTLVGQDASSDLATIYGTSPTSASAALPAMNRVDGTHPRIVGASGGVILASGASAAIRGLTIATTGGTALSSGASFGTLEFANGTTESPDVTINATSSGAISLTSGAVSGSLASVSSIGGTNGVKLSAVSGSLNMKAGSLSGASGATFVVAGGTATVTYAGSLGQTNAGAIAAITGRPGGAGAVTLSGAITCTGSCTGITASNNAAGSIVFSNASKAVTSVGLSNNSGATIDFAGGGLVVSSGFTATGGGTITVRGAGNTINTSVGTALDVENTTIGTGGITFQSITTGGGGANGIVLANTGSTGALTVTGTGGTCTNANTSGCSGGHIRGTIGANGATSGIGIYLSNTLSPSFTRMLIDGTHDNFGLYGTSVTNLTLDNVVMNGTFGNSAASNEGTLSLLNLAGTGTVTAGYFANGVWNNVRVQTTSGGVTLDALTFSGTTFGLTQTGAHAGLQVRADAGTTNVTVNGSSSFLGAHQADVEYLANGGTSNVRILNSTLANGQSAGSSTFNNFALLAGNAGADATGSVDYTISGNTISGSKQAAIFVFKDRGTQALMGAISDNTIGSAAANSGALADGILVEHAASGSNRLLIDGNIIQHYNASAGIRASFIDPSGGALSKDGSLHLTITRNTIQFPNTTAGAIVEGVRLVPNSGSGNHTMCVNFGHGGKGNTLTNSFVGVPDGAFDFGSVNLGGGAGFFKMTGLTTLSDAGITALGQLDNGLAAGTSFSDMTGVTVLSESGAGGASCQLIPAP